MEKLDIPPIPEFIELVADSGANLYACKATVDMFGLDDGRLRARRSTRSSRSASSTKSPPADRSSSPRAPEAIVLDSRRSPLRLLLCRSARAAVK